jgi:signal transduction histidine kinase/CheY-like chemotaxis protein
MVNVDTMRAMSVILSIAPWLLAGIIARTSLRAADVRQRLLPILAMVLIGVALVAPSLVSWELTRARAAPTTSHLETARTWLLASGLVVVFCQAGFLLAWRLALDEGQALESARREAASRAKTEFLAFLGHELRTPLQTILGRAELLQSADTPAARAAAVQAIALEGKLMLRLINDGLDLGAIEAGRFELRPKPISLRALVASVTAPAEAMARAKGLAFVVEVSPAMPDQIMADDARLQQVIGNLLGNAIKFTPLGGVELRVEYAAAHADATGRKLVRLVVRDSGIGLPPERIGHLFAPFTRLVGDRPADPDGRGLGLALVKRLVEHMAGTVTAANRTDGAGAEFVVELPLREVDGGTAPVPEGARPESPPVLRSLRVLVVEDHAAARDVLTDLLHALGHQPAAVGDASAARAALASAPFDAVVLDINLGGEDGTLLAREITGRFDSSTRPRLIGCSADALAEKRALSAGMDVFLTKPVSMADLQSALQGTGARSDDLFSILRRADFNAASRANARTELGAMWDALRKAVANKNRAELRRLAHYLHNSALVLGDDELGRAAQSLARAEAQGEWRGVVVEVEKLLKSSGG